ncbi:bacterial transcriptional activator domain-containing protein [Micromonospora sp. U56]|uniref:AfsR/SARP family transcriptional regulator n=1 Tax=Micromonospora sp. U56 TaxID=2824900 RepID=UPI001FFCF7B5|nr:bacterial transcriptional activator domain-containing protein [Micromonospora sp. U56]
MTDAIWPGLPRHSLPGRLYTTLSELRGSIRTACGLNVIDHTDDRYRLNPTLIDVDLWHLHTAVRHAATAVTHTTTAWQAIIDAYPGDLAAGRRWPWLDPLRERTRRNVIDAYVALADTEPDPHRALTLLQAATRIDPYNTDLHTRVTHTLTTLGDHDTATKTRTDFTRRLIEAGLHPTDAPTTATIRNDAASPSR